MELTLWSQLVGLLGLPGAAAAIAAAFWFGAKAVSVMRAPPTNGNGDTRETHGWMKAVLEQQNMTLQLHTNALHEVTDALSQLGSDFRQHGEQEMAVWREVMANLKDLREEQSQLVEALS